MAELGPSKSDIEAVFTKLRAIPTNKACFDCGAKNPTWSSITYGIFICLDCSAVHRSLGVHLSFVRSTQLDTNWTWQQLRQMQLGGNANATQFFVQHNCETTDAQKKYNSRAAQLYKDKLQQMAINSLKSNPDKLHVYAHNDEKDEKKEKEEDFFEGEENFKTFEVPRQEQINTPKLSTSADLTGQPSVNFDKPVNQEERKHIIGTRKVQTKKSGLGAKKGGLGATKVVANFEEIEREASLADEARARAEQDSRANAARSAEEEEKSAASLRLAYQELSLEQGRANEKLKKLDPKKAEQVERLGMGFGTKAGISHSALNDMQTIEQEGDVPESRNTLNKLGRSNEEFFDAVSSFGSSSFNMNRNSNSVYSSALNSKLDAMFPENNSSRNSDWLTELANEKPKSSYKPVEKPYGKTEKSSPVYSSDNSDVAQKKFGSAKAISSEQFFDNKDGDYETRTALNRFQGSSSISSADLFGTPQKTSHSSFHPPDLDDVKESVRQGVTKVAGKISSLANGVMSSIQDRYGY